MTSPRPVHLADPGTWRRVCRAERSEHPPPGGGAPVPQPLSAIASSTASPAAHTSGEEAALSGSQLGIPANSPFLPDYGAHSRTKVRLGLRASQMSGLRRGSWLMTQPEVELSGRRPRASARLSRQGRQPHCLPLPPPPGFPGSGQRRGRRLAAPRRSRRGNGDGARKRSVSIAWSPAPSLVPNALRTEPPAPHALSLPQGTR